MPPPGRPPPEVQENGAAGLKRSLSAKDAAAAEPAKKKAALVPVQVQIAKTPAEGISGKASGPTSGLMAKGAPATPSAQGVQLKAKSAPPPGKRPTVQAPAAQAPTSPSASQTDAAGLEDMLSDGFAASLDAVPAGAKLKQIVRLAEVMGQRFQIEHVNHFLRVLKKTIVERAQNEGVRASAATAPRPSAKVIAKVITKAIAKVPAKAPAIPAENGGSPDAAVPKHATTANIVKAPATSSFAKVPPNAPSLASPSSDVDDGPLPPSSPPPPQELSDDPLYVLVGELTQDPIVVDGVLRESRLAEVLKRLWDGVARKPKDWVAAWQAMEIPADRQDEALQRLFNMAFVQTEDPDRAPMIVAELVKAHKVKLSSVQKVLGIFGQNLDGILAMNEDAWHVYAQLLVQVFPKPKESGWGWSRVGWSFQSWWQFAEKCVELLDPSMAFDVLGMILRLIQDREGQPLHQVQVWTDGDRLQRVLTKLCELGACEQSEVVDRLSLQGVVVE